MKQCIACDMPLMKPSDFAGGDVHSVSCVHCTDENGSLKSCQEIFEGGVHFFTKTIGASKEEAQKLVRKHMKSLNHWQQNPCECLSGDLATDQEYQAALRKLGF